MKIALFADIHGNFHALEAVLADIGRQRPDRIIVLGDLVFKGPLPEKCVQAVRQLQTVVLRGNIDELVGRNIIQPGFAKSSAHERELQTEMAWTRARLSSQELDYLAELPFSHTVQLSQMLKLNCVHATPQNILDIVLPTCGEDDLSRMFADTDAQVVGYAHIHQPYVRYTKGRALFNTGSVGLPFDGDPRASYAILEADGGSYGISIRRVPYDIEAAVAAFAGAHHPCADSVIAALRTGTRPV